MTHASKDIYLTSIIPLVPQILTQIDRRAGSPTKGCFDREYWQHLSVDFPCMEKQESVLTLWLLYEIEHSSNVYRGSSRLLEWLEDGVGFWCKSQRPNGSFDEWYPHENSMTATAFSTRCITECLIQTKDSIKWKEDVYAHVLRAARWIAGCSEYSVSNQEAGAILALDNTARITGNTKIKEAADNKLKKLLSLQDEEGWFSEYGGADVGYSSVTLAYLAQLWKRSPSERLYSALERLVSFISNFVHLDFSLGGCYGSRNTEYILPLGAEILASKVPLAAGLAAKLRLAYSKRADIGLSNVDHRYLLLHNYFYLESYREARDPLDVPSLNAAQDFSFGRCGIIGRSREGGHIVASLKKGGAFKIASTDRSLTDCGWTVCDSGRVLISYHFPGSLESHLYPEGFKVKGRLKYISTAKMTTLALVALRVYMSTFGRFKFFSRLLKNFSRYILITNSRASGIEFERDVSVNKLGIIVNDTLKGLSNSQVVYLGGSLSYALGPSTGTFRNEQLSVKSLCFKEDDFQGGKLHVERQISWNTELNLFKVNNLKKELSSEHAKI